MSDFVNQSDFVLMHLVQRHEDLDRWLATGLCTPVEREADFHEELDRIQVKVAQLFREEGEDEALPSDYETCSDCGFDHGYEPREAYAFHRTQR